MSTSPRGWQMLLLWFALSWVYLVPLGAGVNALLPAAIRTEQVPGHLLLGGVQVAVSYQLQRTSMETQYAEAVQLMDPVRIPLFFFIYSISWSLAGLLVLRRSTRQPRWGSAIGWTLVLLPWVFGMLAAGASTGVPHLVSQLLQARSLTALYVHLGASSISAGTPPFVMTLICLAIGLSFALLADRIQTGKPLTLARLLGIDPTPYEPGRLRGLPTLHATEMPAGGRGAQESGTAPLTAP